MKVSIDHCLSPHFVGTDPLSGTSCYVIQNPSVFFVKNPIAREILRQCSDLQDSIWKKKYTTYDNTFAQKFLLLYVGQGQVKGFLSGSHFLCADGTTVFYFSDVMLLPEIRGKGLSSLGLAVLQSTMLKSATQLAPHGPFVAIMISGHIGCLKIFHNLDCFSKFKLDFESDFGKEVLHYLRHDFPTQHIWLEGVMKGAWLPQAPQGDNWPKELVAELKLPQDIDGSLGDAACCFFHYDPYSSTLSDYINSRFSFQEVGRGK